MQTDPSEQRAIHESVFSAGLSWAAFGSTLEAPPKPQEAAPAEELSDEEFLFGTTPPKVPKASQPAPSVVQKAVDRKVSEKSAKRRAERLDATMAAIGAAQSSAALAAAKREAAGRVESALLVPAEELVAQEDANAIEALPERASGEEATSRDQDEAANVEATWSPEEAKAEFARLVASPPDGAFAVREADLQEALNIGYSQRNSRMIVAANAALGHFYLAHQHTRSAIMHLNSGISAARSEPAVFPKDAVASLEHMLAQAYVDVGDSRNAQVMLDHARLPPRLGYAMDVALEQGLTDTSALEAMVDAYSQGPFSHVLARAHPETGVTALHVACGRGNVELVRTLLSASVDINKTAKDSQGHSPMVWAARFGGVDVVRCLAEEFGVRMDADVLADADQVASWPNAVKAYFGVL